MRWMVRLAAAVTTAFAGFIISIDSSSLERRGWWNPKPDLVFASMILLAAAVVWQVIDAEIERRRVRRRTELTNEINKLMFPVWYKIQATAPDQSTRERIGVHVWMVPTWHWHLVPEFVRNLTPESVRSRIPTPHMWRACNYRLEEDQHDGTDIRWTRDIGAIGLCWRERKRQYFELPLVWGADELDELQWSGLQESAKMGLNYNQYKRVRLKYYSVLVVPIFKETKQPGSRFIGCVVVDSLSSNPINLNVRRIQAQSSKVAKEIALRVVPIAS